jgi:hypothetical protein
MASRFPELYSGLGVFRSLLQTCEKVRTAPIFDYLISYILGHPENALAELESTLLSVREA